MSDNEPVSSQQICRKERRWSLLQTLIYLSPKGGREGPRSFICFPFKLEGKQLRSRGRPSLKFGKEFQKRNGMIGGGNFDIALPLLRNSKRSSIWLPKRWEGSHI